MDELFVVLDDDGQIHNIYNFDGEPVLFQVVDPDYICALLGIDIADDPAHMDKLDDDEWQQRKGE
jgi:hypothetical protein